MDFYGEIVTPGTKQIYAYNAEFPRWIDYNLG